MAELKPCPFCGGKARLFVNGGVRVICSKCYAGTKSLTDNMGYESNAVETVVEAWNRRAGEEDKHETDLDKFPTIDAVPAIRCRECKQGEVDDPDFPDQYYCHAGCGWNNGDFYCAYGEREEGADNG